MEPVTPEPNSVAIVSGGLDSTTLVYHMIAEGLTPHMLSFNYGQRHSKELRFAEYTAKGLNLKHDIVDLTGLTRLISNSALTAPRMEADPWIHNRPRTGAEEKLFTSSAPSIEVPEGHYAEDSMKATVVPNRNMIMLSIAAGVAVNNKYKAIGIGVHGGDHFIYPDCRPRFIKIANAAIVIGNSGFGPIPEQEDGTWPNPEDYIYAPFLHKTKADIAYRALELGVPLHLTWSCYKGGEAHCGKCGTCVERLEAIYEAIERHVRENETQGKTYKVGTTYGNDVDQTLYEDSEFWKTAVNNA